MLIKAFALNAIMAFAGAVPAAEPEAHELEKRVNCGVVNVALGVLKILGPPATSFCNSYLAVPTATSTTVTLATPPPVTVTTSVETIRQTSTVCPAPAMKRAEEIFEKRASHRQAERDAAVEVEYFEGGSRVKPRAVPADLEKRLVIPPALKAFKAAQISSGCSCLNLGPKTTITATVTPSAATVNVATTTTICTTCDPDGTPCVFERPDKCCGRTCWGIGGGIPTCRAWV